MSVLYDCDMEAGDLSEWNSTATDGGDVSVTAAAALAGTNYGIAMVVNDANSLAVEEYFAKQNILRWRFYFDPNSISMPTDAWFAISHVAQWGGSYNIFFSLNLHWNGSTFQLSTNCVDDAMVTVSDSCNITDAPHYIELHIVKATTDTSADGTFEWWVDGTSQGKRTGWDNYNMMSDPPSGFYVGLDARWFGGGTPTGTIYHDQFVLNNDGSEIGPFSTAPVLSAAQVGSAIRLSWV